MGRVKKHDKLPIYLCRIGALMGKNQHSQSDLAEKIGVSRDRVNNWLQDTAPLDADSILKIAELYSVSTDYILGKSDAETNDADMKAVCDYTGLSVKAVQTLTNRDQIADLIFSMGDDYETADGPQELYDLLVMALESRSGWKFINALCMVKKDVDRIKHGLSSLHEQDEEYRHDYLINIRREAKYHQLELTEAAEELSETLFGASGARRKLDEAIFSDWNDPGIWEKYVHASAPEPDGPSDGYELEESEDGKHQ